MGQKRKVSSEDAETSSDRGAPSANSPKQAKKQQIKTKKKQEPMAIEALYDLPRKVAQISDRLRNGELKGVPLGIVKVHSFKANCSALRENISITGHNACGRTMWTPTEAHFQMNQMFRNWRTGGNEAQKTAILKLKAFIEQEWQSEFMNHKNAK